jgi:hypothetical protein
MVSRQKERFGGAFIATMGIILTYWSWHSAISVGSFSLKAGFAGPAFAILGIALLLFPGYQSERIARGEDISKLTGAQLLTPRWWGVLAVSLGSGLINLAVLKFWRF